MRKILFGLLGLLFSISANAACNLFDMDWLLNAPNWTKNGDVYSGPADSMWSTYASGGKHFPLTFAANTQYTFSGHVGANSANARFTIGYTDGTSEMLPFGIDGDFLHTSSAGKTIGYVNFGNSNSGSIQLSYIQIERGTTVTAYTPYDANCVDPCRNLLSTPMILEGSKWYESTGTIVSTDPDTRRYAQFIIQIIKSGSDTPVHSGCARNFSGPENNVKCTFTTPENTTSCRFYNNGERINSGTSVFPCEPNTQYTFSMDVISANPTIANGIIYSHMQLEKGNTATEFTPACTGINVATTKYTNTQFEPLDLMLSNAISVVDSVVTQTITQAASIATLQSGKQTRPNDIADDNEKCPAGKKCLLVEGTDGKPHWYEIFDPINRWMEAFFKTNPNGQLVDGGVDFRRWQGNPDFRKTYIDGSMDVYSRQWTVASPARTVGGMYQTLPAGDLENAGSWAVEWDGTEGDIDAGAVYGIAKCTSVAGTFATKLTSVQEAAFYELPAPVGQTDNANYPRENFKNCWCKMTAVGVPGADGTAANGDVYPVNPSSSAWVFNGASSPAADCAYNCAYSCVLYVRARASFRSAVFGLSE